MAEEIERIVIENYEDGFARLYELNNPKYVKITLVIGGENVALYEGKEFKNSLPVSNTP